MYLKNYHEYNNVKKVTFGKYKGRLFSKDVWYANVTLAFEDGTEYTARWELDKIEMIVDLELNKEVIKCQKQL